MEFKLQLVSAAYSLHKLKLELQRACPTLTALKPATPQLLSLLKQYFGFTSFCPLQEKLILCLALVLSGGLFGCSSIDHPSTNSTQLHLDYENPLTARQLAEVKKNFHRIRPGMTEGEVFFILDLSGYQHRLHRSNPFMSNDWNIGDYQLADNERLLLFFDNTGIKTIKTKLPNGEKLELLNYASDTSHRLVIHADLDTVAYFTNAPSMWQHALEWTLVDTNVPSGWQSVMEFP